MKTLKKLVTGAVVALGLTMAVGIATEYKAQAKIKVYGPQIVEDEVELYPKTSADIRLTTAYVSKNNKQYVNNKKVKAQWRISNIKVSNKSIAKAKAIKSYRPKWSTKYDTGIGTPTVWGKRHYGLKNYVRIIGKNVKTEKKCKVTITYKTRVFGKTFKKKRTVTVIVKPKGTVEEKAYKQRKYLYDKNRADYNLKIGDKVNVTSYEGYIGVDNFSSSNECVQIDKKGNMTAISGGNCTITAMWDDGTTDKKSVHIDKDNVKGEKISGLLVKRSKKSALIQFDKVEGAKEYKIYCKTEPGAYYLLGTVYEKDYWNNQTNLRQFVYCKYTEKNGDMVYDGPSPKAVKKMTANERKKYLMTYGCKTKYSPKSTYTIKVVATDGVNTTPEASVTSKGKTFKKKELYPHYEYMAEQNEIIKKQAELKGKKPYAMTIWDVDYERGMKLHTGRISKIQAHILDEKEENQGLFVEHKLSGGEENLGFIEGVSATTFFVHEKHGYSMEALSDISGREYINHMYEGICAYTGEGITLVNLEDAVRGIGYRHVAINKNQWK
ncbi:MAG: hypothetical protein K6G64_05565 [Eubacterium sp.]|nr:hypothetical protein [Eubacterium sp.]